MEENKLSVDEKEAQTKKLFMSPEEEHELNEFLQFHLNEYNVKEISLRNLMDLIKMRNELGKNVNFEKETAKRLKKLVGDFKDADELRFKLASKDTEIRKKQEADLKELHLAFQLYNMCQDKNIKESTIDARIKKELKDVKKLLKVKK